MPTKPIIYTNIINPIFWMMVILYIKWYLKIVYIRFNKDKSHIINIIIISILHIIIFFNIGLIFGFSKSPYNHSLVQILKNICVQAIPIVGIELIRWIIVCRNKNNKFILFVITILLFLIEINYSFFNNSLIDKEDMFEYIISTIIPLFFQNILCTYLVRKESYLITLIYKIFGKVIILILPIIPNINWFIYGSANILSIITVYVLFKYKFNKIKKDTKSKKKNNLEKISYIITLFLSTSLICFMLGLFKYEPIVILSNSMEPTFSRGDVVIYKKIDVKNIQKNDIIIYSIGEQNIAHRVIDITEDDGTYYFKTKGDRNNTSDMIRVTTENIKGVYVFHIKYLGFPSIWLHDYFNEEEAKVET